MNAQEDNAGEPIRLNHDNNLFEDANQENVGGNQEAERAPIENVNLLAPQQRGQYFRTINLEMQNMFMRSLGLKVIEAFFSLGKIVASLVMMMVSKGKCSLFDIYLILMILHDIVNVVYCYLRICVESLEEAQGVEGSPIEEEVNNDNFMNNHERANLLHGGRNHLSRIARRNREREFSRLVESIYKCNSLFYIILFIWAHFLLFFLEHDCDKEAPAKTTLVLVYLLMAYVCIFYPVLLLLIFCICLPFIIIVIFYNYYPRESPPTAAAEDTINKLKVRTYKKEKYPHENECVICKQEYEIDSQLIVLPCNKKHFFHSHCIKQWLNLNGLCPICRKRLPNNMAEQISSEESQINQAQTQADAQEIQINELPPEQNQGS